MKIIKNIDEIKDIVREWKKQGYSIGLVPTMGYLHKGHGSLIEKAVAENDKVVISVFVNPIQFGPNEDFSSYPRDIEKDAKLCDTLGADIVFNPEPKEMYGEDFSSYLEVQGITEGLCGAKRPGHFRGVTTVVAKLFNITEANRAYFGEKDAQQLAVIKKMVKDFNMNIEIRPCPIVREKDGLAMSSRNTYLSEEERRAALVLNKSLRKAKEALRENERSTEALRKIIKEHIYKEPLAKIDYVEIVDSISLKPCGEVINKNILIAIAVYIGNTRLIDNFTYEV